MEKTITQTKLNFPKTIDTYKGKVRDVYTLENELIVVVATDRISAFDHVLPRGIPYKGQILNQIAAFFLDTTKDIVPNWLIACPSSSVSVGHLCKPIRIEMVIRGHLAGHASRVYKAGKRELCGVQLPEGMKENEPFKTPIITPAIKVSTGHDEDISREEILRNNSVPEEIYLQMEEYTKALFQRGTEMARERGLILVDAKYEFGLKDGKVMLMDELHTPDSSRYFYAEGYTERQEKGLPQVQLSKEFVREWLIENGFQGLDGQQLPNIPDTFVQEISQRYIELYEILLGKKFLPETNPSIDSIQERVVEFIKTVPKQV